MKLLSVQFSKTFRVLKPQERASESKLRVYSQNTLRMLLCIKLLLELLKFRDSHTYNINKKVKWR